MESADCYYLSKTLQVVLPVVFVTQAFTWLPLSCSTLTTSFLSRTIAHEGNCELKDCLGSGRPSLMEKKQIEWGIANGHIFNHNPHVPKLVLTANALVFCTVIISQVYLFVVGSIFTTLIICCIKSLAKFFS